MTYTLFFTRTEEWTMEDAGDPVFYSLWLAERSFFNERFWSDSMKEVRQERIRLIEGTLA